MYVNRSRKRLLLLSVLVIFLFVSIYPGNRGKTIGEAQSRDEKKDDSAAGGLFDKVDKTNIIQSDNLPEVKSPNLQLEVLPGTHATEETNIKQKNAIAGNMEGSIPKNDPVDTAKNTAIDNEKKKSDMSQKDETEQLSGVIENEPSLVTPPSNQNGIRILNELYKRTYEKFGKELLRLQKNEKCNYFFSEFLKQGLNLKDQSATISNINAYTNCFIGNNVDGELDLHKIDSLINPQLSLKLPLFQKWNGDLSYGPPLDSNDEINTDVKFLKENQFEYKTELVQKFYNFDVDGKDNRKVVFWDNFKSLLSGQGIVISVGHELVEEVLRFLKILRILKTTLPIQLVHRGDLTAFNKLTIVQNSRSDLNDHVLDVTFVDVSFCLKETPNDFYSHYLNKLLGYAFNSFKEMIMLDTDILLFKNPEAFFETSQYLTSKSLFFKDRNYKVKTSPSIIEYLKLVVPKQIDQIMFGLNPVTDEIIDSMEYFQDLNYHYMEAGVVVIDKFHYMKSVPLLLMIPLFDTTFLQHLGWGDKEFYWVSLFLSGNYNYKFNDHWAVAVGKPYTNPESHGASFHRICTSQPAHILSDNGELVWMNSGAIKCKKEMSRNELNFEYQEYKKYLPYLTFESPQQLEAFYYSPIDFEAYIEPPKAKYQLNLKAPARSGNFVNVGWGATPLCSGYIWCATDVVGDNEVVGTYKTFTEDEIMWYNYIRDAYLESEIISQGGYEAIKY